MGGEYWSVEEFPLGTTLSDFLSLLRCAVGDNPAHVTWRLPVSWITTKHMELAIRPAPTFFFVPRRGILQSTVFHAELCRADPRDVKSLRMS